MTGLFEGMLLFFLLGSDVFINYRIKVIHAPQAEVQLAEATP